MSKAKTADTMKLSVHDRYVLIQSLPQAGLSAVAMKMVDALVGRLVLTPSEQGRAKVEAVGEGGVAWKENFEADVELSVFERQFIKRELEKMSEREQLTIAHRHVWDLFVGA